MFTQSEFLFLILGFVGGVGIVAMAWVCSKKG